MDTPDHRRNRRIRYTPGVIIAMTAAASFACSRYEWVPDYETPACATDRRPTSGRSFSVERGAAVGSGSLHGRVVVSASQRPVPGATVTLLAEPARKTTTDSLGAFTFTGVPPGTHLIGTRRIGYQSRVDTLRVAHTGSAELVLPLDAMMLDGPCSGFAAVRVRKPWWKLW